VVSLFDIQNWVIQQYSFLVELDLICAESEADDFSSSLSMYIASQISIMIKDTIINLVLYFHHRRKDFEE
jgi:hypothetical protein